MPALVPGQSAPDFSLPAMNGSQFSLHEALMQGPVVAVFFKISCPVCQLALPFLERIYRSQGREKVAIVGISQNEASDTALFVKRYGISFPILSR